MNFQELLIFLKDSKRYDKVTKKTNIDKKRKVETRGRKKKGDDADRERFPVVMYMRTTQEGHAKMHMKKIEMGMTLSELYNEMIDRL